jgi:rubrerythrin
MRILKIEKAQDMSLVKSNEELTDRELTRALRDAIIAEETAIQQYENIADSTSNQTVKDAVQEIANEEKIHVGELQELLAMLLKDEQGFLDAGAEEVEKGRNE